jgi:hypothetical protein
MSASSFPRSEHVSLLKQKIQERVHNLDPRVEVTERGLNHLKCQYKFGLRRAPAGDWNELAIHFQVAERLESTGNEAELNRILDGFLGQRFS